LVSFRLIVGKGGVETEPLFDQAFQLQPGESITFGRSLAQNDLVVPDPTKARNPPRGPRAAMMFLGFPRNAKMFVLRVHVR